MGEIKCLETGSGEGGANMQKTRLQKDNTDGSKKAQLEAVLIVQRSLLLRLCRWGGGESRNEARDKGCVLQIERLRSVEGCVHVDICIYMCV